PNTGSAGSWHLAHRVCQSAQVKSLKLACRVYTYPTPPSDDAPANRPGSDHADLSDPGGGSGHAEANGNGNGNGHGNGNGNSAAMRRAAAAPQRERLMPFVLQGMSQE